jgi:hypothetical protein
MTDLLPDSAPDSLAETQIVPTDYPKAKSLTVMEKIADIPEEEIWLAKQKSARTRRAYGLDLWHFMAALDITTTDELRQADHRAVIAWERTMRETKRAAPFSITVIGNRGSSGPEHGLQAHTPITVMIKSAVRSQERRTAPLSPPIRVPPLRCAIYDNGYQK